VVIRLNLEFKSIYLSEIKTSLRAFCKNQLPKHNIHKNHKNADRSELTPYRLRPAVNPAADNLNPEDHPLD